MKYKDELDRINKVSKNDLSGEDLINLWLIPIHNEMIQVLFKNNPNITSDEFYDTYPVTQQQHDEWYDQCIDLVRKKFRISKKVAKRKFAWTYLNAAPKVLIDQKT
jgi:hypothetical protein